jgi:hypothetical protein
MIASAFLILLGVYFACGFVFALAFVFWGAQRIDPHAGPGTWGFRLLIIPGSMAFWPLLLYRWTKGIHEPPEEGNAHRHLARQDSRQSASIPRQAK